MEDNIWKLREILRKIESLGMRINQIESYLNRKIDNGDVSDDLIRSLSSPVEELEWRISDMDNNMRQVDE